MCCTCADVSNIAFWLTDRPIFAKYRHADIGAWLKQYQCWLGEINLQPVCNDFDVTNKIKTTDPVTVEQEIARLYRLLYPRVAPLEMTRAFADVAKLYAGRYPGYLACDTSYHNLQHVLDVTLAMARLMDGYERSRGQLPPLGGRLFQLGIVCALFHDIGYLRRDDDLNAHNGAVYTLNHVSRGATFVAQYLPTIGFEDFSQAAAELLHFTGFEKRVADISIHDPLLRTLGSLLGSADIIAQMADRCYLEKCRDRLYPEFLWGGIAEKPKSSGEVEVVFSSGDDLVKKTPIFFESAVNRLEYDLGGAYNYAASHFGGFNLYLYAATKNVHFAKQFSVNPRYNLRRALPTALIADGDEG